MYLMSGGFDLTVIIKGRTMRGLPLCLPSSWRRWKARAVLVRIFISKIQGQQCGI